MSDRRVHATSRNGDIEVVRYDRAGKWVVERSAGSMIPCRRVTLDGAVEEAIRLVGLGGRVIFDQPGGRAFDRRVRGATARA